MVAIHEDIPRTAPKNAVEEVLRNRILFIGGDKDPIPNVSHPDGVQVYYGSPAELIKELATVVEEFYSS